MKPLAPKVNTGYIRLFKFYGVETQLYNQQLQGDCPFTDCENPNGHFFANPGTGQWDCKRCGRSGNHYDFIRQFHEHCLAFTTDDDYKNLSEVREGISYQTFKIHKLAYNYLLDEWLLPAYNMKGNLSNLYSWKQQSTFDGPQSVVMSGPVFKQIMYGLQHYHKDKSRPLWILEGHWDLLAFFDALYLAGQLDYHDFIAVPGATTFPDEDVSLFSQRDVRLVYDHDQAGDRGIHTAIQKIAKNFITPASLVRYVWDKSRKDGFDLRDLKIEVDKDNVHPSERKVPPHLRHIHPKQNGQVICPLIEELCKSFFKITIDPKKHANENYDPKARLIPCDNFHDLCDSVRLKLELPHSLEDVLAINCAIAATTNLFEKPIWSYFIGPAGSGKTTIVELFNTASDHCFGISKMTGLLSGFFKEGMGDASLLQHFQGKCVIIKDFTTILKMSPQIVDNMFGELRDMYDGSTAAFYRNYVKRVFRGIRFNMIACVTDMIRTVSNTDVGERFLAFEYDSYWDEAGYCFNGIDEREMTRRATRNVLVKVGHTDNTDSLLHEQRGTAWGFLTHIIDRIKEDKTWVQSKVQSVLENETMLDYIENLARWTAAARSVVKRDREKQIMFRPKVESEKRLAEQLSKCAIALCLVLDETAENERVKACVRKLALDTGYGFQQEIMFSICHSEGRKVHSSQLVRDLNMSNTSIFNYLRDMQELGTVQFDQVATGWRGNQPHVYRLSDRLSKVAEELGFCIHRPADS